MLRTGSDRGLVRDAYRSGVGGASRAADPGTQHGPASRFRRLRQLIEQPELAFLMEAHSGLSAKLVEEAGFAGVWASGLSMSASLGLRDNNEASWTQVLEQAEYMADATDLPILLDGDTGYGNFNNVRRLVRKLCERGIAGVCIEDKLFPKTNSFIGEAQPLADIEEFCGRIKAAKDHQPDEDFVLVARVEALISGHPMAEALKRAEAYRAAGADAILMHSKKRHAGEILQFMKEWGDRGPVVIVPTMYYSAPTSLFRDAGVSTVIWANHMVRSAVAAMRETAARIRREESLVGIEAEIASVAEIFALTENDELESAGRRYLPEAAVPPPPADAPGAVRARGIVLAASKGEALGAYTAERPKCMVDLRGRPLLAHLLETMARSGVGDVAVVRGYRKEAISADSVGRPGITLLDNDEHASSGEVASLLRAGSRLEGDTVIVYGDVLFRRYILDTLLSVKADLAIAVDALSQRAAGGGDRHLPNPRDLVAASRPFSASYLDDGPAYLSAIGDIPPEAQVGEWIGLLRVSAQGAVWVAEELARMREDGSAATADLPALLSRLAARHPVAVHYITGHWLDVDTIPDLADARNFS